VGREAGVKICVFCSSSDAVDGAYLEAAAELGRLVGGAGHTLVWGGGDVGLMGAAARGARGAGGEVIGVIPQFMHRQGVAYRDADRMIVTRDMHERKAAMEEMADAFVALPGGFGTLEEITEVITLRTFGVWAKPLVVVNTAGFYAPLVALFERFYAERFAKPEFRAVCAFVDGPAEAMDYIRDFTPPALVSKWF
jgi:cytokinin riboside 5'-monophosphate phosphoribohydrolase